MIQWPEYNPLALTGAHAVLATIMPVQYDQHHCICFGEQGVEPECYILLSYRDVCLHIDRLRGSSLLFEHYVKTLMCVLGQRDVCDDVPLLPTYPRMSCHMVRQCMYQQPYETTDACVVATCRLARESMTHINHIPGYASRVFTQYVNRYLRTSEAFEVHRQCLMTAALIYKRSRSMRVRKKLYKGVRTLRKRVRCMLLDGIFSRLFLQANERLIDDVLRRFKVMWKQTPEEPTTQKFGKCTTKRNILCA